MSVVQHDVPLKLLGNAFDDRELNRQEWVESGRNILARVALDCRLELAVHQVNDDRAVAGCKRIPVLLCHHLIRAVQLLAHLDDRFLGHTI